MCGNEWESMVRKRMAGHIRRRRRLLRQNCFAGDLRGEPRLQRGVQHEYLYPVLKDQSSPPEGLWITAIWRLTFIGFERDIPLRAPRYSFESVLKAHSVADTPFVNITCSIMALLKVQLLRDHGYPTFGVKENLLRLSNHLFPSDSSMQVPEEFLPIQNEYHVFGDPESEQPTMFKLLPHQLYINVIAEYLEHLLTGLLLLDHPGILEAIIDYPFWGLYAEGVKTKGQKIKHTFTVCERGWTSTPDSAQDILSRLQRIAQGINCRHTGLKNSPVQSAADHGWNEQSKTADPAVEPKMGSSKETDPTLRPFPVRASKWINMGTLVLKHRHVAKQGPRRVTVRGSNVAVVDISLERRWPVFGSRLNQPGQRYGDVTVYTYLYKPIPTDTGKPTLTRCPKTKPPPNPTPNQTLLLAASHFHGRRARYDEAFGEKFRWCCVETTRMSLSCCSVRQMDEVREEKNAEGDGEEEVEGEDESESDLSELVDSDAGDEEEASADDEGNETDMVQSEEDYVGHE
ncbi:hypothetical protein B0H13DRAFT_2564027 [Mycena leptocephala]|nr:hypothetical protein B0H13DRAFT_2564027 [Mycena leptocephala]